MKMIDHQIDSKDNNLVSRCPHGDQRNKHQVILDNVEKDTIVCRFLTNMQETGSTKPSINRHYLLHFSKRQFCPEGGRNWGGGGSRREHRGSRRRLRRASRRLRCA
ncbi:MAG: hypothetical protein J6X39_07330, partial [Bacteroidales bacterium]|nr:hypothetical protein [Bacteroidales bacterium]